MPTLADHIDTIRRYLKAIQASMFAGVEAVVTPDVAVRQLPNRIYPQGVRANRSQMSESFEKRRKLLSNETYEIKNAVAQVDAVVVEVSGPDSRRGIRHAHSWFQDALPFRNVLPIAGWQNRQPAATTTVSSLGETSPVTFR